MVDRKAGLVYVVDDVPDDGDAVTWDASLRQWVPRAGATAESLGLGKYVAVGYAGNPTWIDPAATDWADVEANNFPWVQFFFSGATKNVYIFAGSGNGSINTALNAGPDGASLATTDGDGFTVLQSFQGVSQILVGPNTSQTAPMVDLASGLLAVAPDGSVGGVAPTLNGAIRWDGSTWVASAT